MKMKWSYLAFLLIVVFLIPTCTGNSCVTLSDKHGEIFRSVDSYYGDIKCWILEVPKNTYVRMNLEQNCIYSSACHETNIKITEIKTNKSQTFCYHFRHNSTILTALSDVNISFYHQGSYGNYYNSRFNLSYHIEDTLCTKENHFRCTHHSCIHQSKVCDGVEDCENGADEIGCVLKIKGVKESREQAITWLKTQKSPSSSWGRNTHRAITALYLAQEFSFHGQNLDEELIAKQLELETTLALLKNSTETISVSELSMFVDALTATCHNPRQFYGLDLLQILGDRVSIQESPSPRAYLTLCASNWTLSESDIGSLLKLLQTDSKYPFRLDVQAVAMMALTCAMNKMTEFVGNTNALKTYRETIEKLVDSQLSDGSFGNVYTTALVTQALIASKQEVNKRWEVPSTMHYLMSQFNSSADFLSAYLVLPIFSGRSLLDIETVNCTNSSRKGEKDEISDLKNKIGARKLIQYSLYIGDQKDIIHTIFMKMPENSSAYDVMRIAQAVDPKYKFLHRDVSGHMYVYQIAGITNDPEAGQFWLLYTGDNHINGTVTHHEESPDEFFLGDAENLIMWYKSAHI